MSIKVRVFQVDAFTDARFAGNPAGVVLDAGQLNEAQMLAIARELNNGDTAFVLPPTAGDHDLAIRFFTPRKEAAFVGHATLAAHAVLAAEQPRPLRRQSGKTGIVEVRTQADGGFAIRQSAPPLGRGVSGEELQQVLELLGLRAEQLDAALPPRIAGSASTRLLLAVREAGALDALKPQLAALAELSARIGAQGYFVFTRHPAVPDCRTESRMFCPALGIDEDPVSGNAHGMLGVFLHTCGQLPGAGAARRFRGAQGRHVGRPGRVDVELELDAADQPTAVTIAGRAVIVFETVLSL